MSKTKYDAIVIGAGISGLSTGALLTQQGKKVLVLEKLPYIGGRIGSTKYKGHILDDGAHMPCDVGHIEKVFEICGLEYPEILGYTKGEGYTDGEWKSMRELFPLDEARGAFKEFAAMSDEELESYTDISVKDWTDRRKDIKYWRELFEYYAQLVLVGNKIEDLSMGELIYFFREHFLLGKTLHQIGGTVAGGLSSLTEPLRNYINTHGGEVRLGCPVNDIIVKDGNAKGVEIEVGERIFPSQVLETKFIESDIVVSSIPLWDLFNVISEDEFPISFRNRINSLKENMSHVWTIVYATDKPLWDIDMFRWVPKLPRAGLFGIFFQHKSYGDEVDEIQVNFVLQGNHTDLPDLSQWHLAKTRRTVRHFLDLLDEDIREIIPGLAEADKWRLRHAAFFGLAESPYLAGYHRPSIVPPGIKNLYLVGDTVAEARGLGIQTSAKVPQLLMDKLFPK